MAKESLESPSWKPFALGSKACLESDREARASTVAWVTELKLSKR